MNAPLPQMANRAMARGIASGGTLDLTQYRQPDGTYLLPRDLKIEDLDLCDAERETWMWSAGRHVITGELRAAPDCRYYQDPNWICEWLR